MYVHYPDKYLYLSPLSWSKTTLIASCVGGKGVNAPAYKIKTIFLMSLALSVPSSTKNLIGHELWNLLKFGQILKVSTACVR